MSQKQYWNGVADKKKFTTPFHIEQFKKYVNEGDLILDLGCGYGRTLNELYKLGYRNSIGIDFSESMIKRGKSEFPYLDLRIKDTSKIDLADNSVDAVILFAVLTCISNDEEQKKLIEDIKRVLKPGGIIYVNDFLLNNDERNLNRYDKSADKYGTYGVFELEDGAVCRHHSEEWIHELLKSFDEKEFENVTFKTMNGHTSNGFYFIGKALGE